MNQESGKLFHWGRNGKRICVLLIVLLLSGLFGCEKKDTYTVSLEGQDYEEVSGGVEASAKKALWENEGTEDDASIKSGTSAGGAYEENTVGDDNGSRIYVHICGAVKYPGVYEFTGDTRVFQVVESAGGLSPEAYEAALNQAGVVKDGERIYVPTLLEWDQGTLADLEESREEEIDDGLVNINTADENELCTLPGVGETRAKAIVEYREEHGSFEKIEDIQNVSGIKSGLFGKIKDFIKVK